MPSEIYGIGDQEAADTHTVHVPSGAATNSRQQPNRALSPAAHHSDDQAPGVTHSEPVVRRGGKTTDREKPTTILSPAATNSDGQERIEARKLDVVRGGGRTNNHQQPIEPMSPAALISDDPSRIATHNSDVVNRGRGHPRFDTHTPHASSSKNYDGRKTIVGEADQSSTDIQSFDVGFPAINPIPGGQAIRGPQSSTAAGGEASQTDSEIHSSCAGLSDPSPDDHSPYETQGIDVAGAGEASQLIADTQKRGAGLSTLIEEIREQWRRRQVWHRAEKSLTLQAKATCRRLVEGDKIKANALFKAAYTQCDGELAEVAFAATFPLVEAGKSVELHRKAVEKRLLKLAAQLPIADFILGLRGVGLLSLAGIVGEAGDLSIYPNPAKLWKRMGVGLVDGGRQRRLLDKEAALRHGYSPSRRSHMWNIGSCIIKAGGPLKDLYVERKEYELTKPETASKLHAHRKAQRYVEKRLLREMWCEWRKH